MKTKRPSYLLLCLLFCGHVSWSQEVIGKMDKLVQDTKKDLASYKKIEKVNTPEGTSCVYVQDRDLKLIRINTTIEKTERQIEWFYLNGEIAYIETNWYEELTGKNVYNEKFYFDRGHLFHWYDTRYGVHDNGSAEFNKMGADLIAYCKKAGESALK